MGRERKKRSSKYNKRRLPRGFYLEHKTGTVTKHGEGVKRRRLQKEQSSSTPGTSTPGPSTSYYDTSGTTPSKSQDLSSSADFFQQDTEQEERVKRKRELPQITHVSETDDSSGIEDPPIPTRPMSSKEKAAACGGASDIPNFMPDTQFFADIVESTRNESNSSKPVLAPSKKKRTRLSLSKVPIDSTARAPTPPPDDEPYLSAPENSNDAQSTCSDTFPPRATATATATQQPQIEDRRLQDALMELFSDSDSSDGGGEDPTVPLGEQMAQLAMELVKILHPYPKECGKKVTKFMSTWSKLIQELCAEGEWRDYQTMLRWAYKDLPRVFVSVRFYNRSSGRYLDPFWNLSSFPRKQYPLGRFGSLWESAGVKLMDIYNVHCKLHPDTDKVIDLSIDGISKDKSSQIPIEVFSVRFPNCKRIYTWCAVKVCVHEAYDLDEFLDACIQQIIFYNFRVRWFISDAPILNLVRKKVAHTGFWGCPCCQARGKTEKIENDGGARCYGRSALQAEKWTHEKIEEVADGVVSGEYTMPEERMGVTGKSLLFRLPGFDVAKQAVPDLMHLNDLGVGKKLVALTFTGSPSPPCSTHYKRQSPDKANNTLAEILVPSALNNPKPFEVGKMKAQDFQNATCFYAFAVISSISPVNLAALRVRRVWALWCFVTRLYRLSAEEFLQHTEASIKKILATFLDAWIAAFGKRTCVYNVHVAAAHLLEIRGGESAAKKSAYEFEHSYSKTRRAYAPGTDNVCLQIIRGNQLYLQSTEGHWCKRKGIPTPRNARSHRKDDSWFYTFSDSKYRFYRVTKDFPPDDQHVMARLLCTDPVQDVGWPGVDPLRFDKVGVFMASGLIGDPIPFPKKKITGKAVYDTWCIYSVPNDVLDNSG